MNYLFLDIDGVLNSLPFCERTKKELNPYNIELLAKACEKYNFKVVLSSTWREIYCEEPMYLELVQALKEYGITIYGKTAVLKFDRPLEILTWLRVHAKETDKFVSVEDDFHKEDYAKYGIENCLVQTKYFCMTEDEGGLQEKHLEEIDKIMMV